MEPQKTIDIIKNAIIKSDYFWLIFNENINKFNLSENQYYDICKTAIDLYPHQLHRAHTSKLSDIHYLELATQMAAHGVIDTFRFGYKKLSSIKTAHTHDIVYDICKKAILSSTGPYDKWPGNEPCYAIQKRVYQTGKLIDSDYAKLCLYMTIKFPLQIDRTKVIDFGNRGMLSHDMVNNFTQEIISNSPDTYFTYFPSVYYKMYTNTHEIASPADILDLETDIVNAHNRIFQYCTNVAVHTAQH